MAKIDGNKLTPQSKALQIFEEGVSDYPERLWEFFSFLSFGETELPEHLLNHMDSIDLLPWQNHLVGVGKAKYLSVLGRLFESHKAYEGLSKNLFQLDLEKKLLSEIQSFWHYESGILAEKIVDYKRAVYCYNVGHSLSKNKSLRLAFEISKKRVTLKHDPSSLDSFLVSLRQIESLNIPTLECLGWLSAGKSQKVAGDQKKNFQYLAKSLEIAQSFNLSLLEKQVTVAHAVSKSRWGLYDEARDWLTKISYSGALDPIIPTKLEILAVIEQRQKNIDAAVKYVKDALKISLKLDHIFKVPDESLFLGEQFENHYKDLDQAEKYYQIGYEHAIRYAEHGISLSGDRKKVVDAYLRVLKKKRKTSGDQKPSQADQFSFAEGKSWKRIKDIFHHQLILYHATELPNRKQMAKKLDMPPTTLYSVQNRLEGRGYLLPAKGQQSSDTIEQLQDFIEEHDALSWTEINEIFEREMMHYLYEKYGYNKQRMATILELSYPALLNKTRELTQVDDHLLPN